MSLKATNSKDKRHIFYQKAQKCNIQNQISGREACKILNIFWNNGTERAKQLKSEIAVRQLDKQVWNEHCNNNTYHLSFVSECNQNNYEYKMLNNKFKQFRGEYFSCRKEISNKMLSPSA